MSTTTWDTTDCFRFFRQSLLSSEVIALTLNTTLTFFCPTTREAFASFYNLARSDVGSSWYRILVEPFFLPGDESK
jgi:hypothetical protein